MKNQNLETEPLIGHSRSAHDAWTEAHGLLKSLARTILESSSDGDLIISTAILTTGHSMEEGFFAGLETRVFGGRCHGHNSFFESSGNPQDAIRKAIKDHSMMVERVVEAYLCD